MLIKPQNTLIQTARIKFAQMSWHHIAQSCWHIKLTVTKGLLELSLAFSFKTQRTSNMVRTVGEEEHVKLIDQRISSDVRSLCTWEKERSGSLHTTTNAVPNGVRWLVVAIVTVARLDSTIRKTYSQGCESPQKRVSRVETLKDQETKT